MVQNIKLKVGDFYIANNLPMVLLAGPCQLETTEHALMIAREIKKICDK